MEIEENRVSPFTKEHDMEFKISNNMIDDEVREYAKIKFAGCYEKILEVINYYVDLPEEQAKLIAIWIMGTYFHKSFKTYPFLFLNAMRGSGKTRLLRLINILSYKGDGNVTNSVTEAVLFRHPKHQIMCIDEIEGIGRKENAQLRELLNSAYKRGMVVQRMKKMRVQGQEQQVVETFEPFFPICLANIWGLEEVLSDRAITIVLEKSAKSSVIKKGENFEENNDILSLSTIMTHFSVVCVDVVTKKTSITAWNNYVELKYNNGTNDINDTNGTNDTNNTNNTNNIYNTNNTNNTSSFNISKEEEIERDDFFRKIDESNISGRNLELFLPLFLVANHISREVFEEILQISKRLVDAKRDEEYTESKDVSLYQYIAEHGDEKNFVPLKLFTDHFRLFCGDTQMTDEAWCNEKWVGRALKRLGLIIERKREASGRFIRVNVDKAKEKLNIFK